MTVEMRYYYTADQEEIVEGHIGEFVAIDDGKVLPETVTDTELAAPNLRT
jgi:hypothetical protein